MKNDRVHFRQLWRVVILTAPFIGAFAMSNGALANSNVMAPSRNHTCYVKDGGVLCLGRSREGETGPLSMPGAMPSQPKWVIPAGSNVVKVSSRGEYTCALLSGGAVSCWGQIKQGDITYAPEPQPLAAPAIDIAVGDDHACAVLNTTEVQCWGSNQYGQLGRSDITNDWSDTPVYAQMVYKDANGTTVRSRLDRVSALAAGEDHNCVLRDNGNVRCWGLDLYGNLGNGSGDERITCQGEDPCRKGAVTVSRLPAGSGVVALGAGYNHTCAMKNNGTTWCWGLNSSGQLGNGNQIDSYSPVRVLGLPVSSASISGGEGHTCGYASGRVFCWGDNSQGQVTGSPSASPVFVPSEYNFSPYIPSGAATGANHSCFNEQRGGIFCIGDYSSGKVPADGWIVKPPPTCYILTAAYGSPTAPEIQTLWALHHRLVPNWDAPWHQAYLRWYDRVGPRVAAFIQERPILKTLVRAGLRPIITGSRWWLGRHLNRR